MDLEYMFRELSVYFSESVYNIGKRKEEAIDKINYLTEKIWNAIYEIVRWEVEYAIQNSELNDILKNLDELDKKFIVNRATHRVLLLTMSRFIENVACYMEIYTYYALQQSISLALRDTTLKEIRDIILGVKKRLEKSIYSKIEDIVLELLNINVLQLPKGVDKNGSS